MDKKVITQASPRNSVVIMYGLGLDPGYVKLGVGVLELKTGKMTMASFNLTRWSNETHFLRGRDMWFVVKSFVEMLRPLLLQTVYVGIEDQPPMANPKVVRVQTHLESLIRVFHSSINVYLVSPRSVRCFWFTSGKTYLERKANSLKTNLLTQGDLVNAMTIFDDCVDPIEAMQICIYVAHKKKKLDEINLKDSPRHFSHTFYTCTESVGLIPYRPKLKCSRYFVSPLMDVNHPASEEQKCEPSSDAKQNPLIHRKVCKLLENDTPCNHVPNSVADGIKRNMFLGL